MLKGVFPAIPTCFTEDGNVDFEEQKKVIDFVIESGAHGIVFPGTASEYSFLKADECIKLVKLLVEKVDGKLPIIGGIGASSLEASVELGKEIGKFGISHFMLMAPHRFEKDVEKHKAFYKEVAAQLPKAEIILQNAPYPIGAGLSAEEMIEIAKDNPSIKYIKEETLPSGPVISALLNSKMPHLLGVFGGGGARYIIDELNRGAIGAVPAAEITDLHVSIYNAFQSGDINKARSLYCLSLPLLTAQKIYRMELTKYVLKKRDITDALFVRAPLPKLDTHARQDIDDMLKDLEKENVLI